MKEAMRNKVGVGVSLNELLLLKLDQKCRKLGLKRTALIEKAVEQYLAAEGTGP